MDTSGLDLRFRIGITPITVTPMFWLSGLILMQRGLEGPRIVLWLLIYFVSVLVHEMGHALASQAYGARSEVTLHSFGGVAVRNRALSRWRSIAVALAGPGAGFVLGAIALAVLFVVGPALSPMAHWVLMQLIYVNFIWGLMNLLPIPPLDGGNVLLGVLGRRHERTAHIISVVVAGLVVLWGLTTGQIFMVVLFGLLAFQNVQTLRALGGR